MKRLILVLISTIFFSGCTSTTEENITENTNDVIVKQEIVDPINESKTETIETDNLSDEVISSAKKYDFINSFDGQQCSVEMLTFAKRYFNSDIEGINIYFINGEADKIDFSSNEIRNYSDIKYILVKGLVYDEETEIVNAQLEYAWEGVQMNYYIDISMKKINDSWKVVDFLIDV